MVIAESDEAIEVEGNLYFPLNSVKTEYLEGSEKEYTCPWKGQAGYYDVVVKGETYRDAAWSYYEPSEAAMKIKDYVAFESGIKVEGKSSSRLTHP
jgi:uncharacterized protein (DUF427 family)